MSNIRSREEACMVLGLPATADEHQIKCAYKELSKKYHPDAQPNAELHWQYYDIVEAYRYLMTSASSLAGAGYQPVPKGPRILGNEGKSQSWTNQRKESEEAYTKWEKARKQRKKEKEAALKERQQEIKQQRQYDEAMEQINAIRTARAIEAILDIARKK
ncbi:MAG: DnaJ domain-containing protein [Lachnospiraceae bacterium]|nr:DnaJ domain-containing protein [Lachnospiraceae bacterium]